ncbi:glycosyltransferase [Denitrobaculum tricleocarpae]|uniref:Glycosyltransferase n=1 Tax=Denitrobaculum tricleocarpae TaxID=2591009 RepID=A0A545TGL7_9PROT|nr:glycosyltransferase [Denitrobaculum tricleocarpae]TQV76271.1 glycosyltransferase [Denitrobaculum tricleocarpae]
MRVLFGTGHSYLPQRSGGSESSTHDLCIEMQKQGIEPGVLASIEPEGWLGLKNRLQRRVFSQREFPADRTMGYPVYRGWHPETGIAEVAMRFKPDVAILQAGRPLQFASLLLDQGIPSIVYLRDILFDKLGGDVEKLPGLRYIANSRFTADTFEDHTGITAPVVPPLVRPEAYRTETARQAVVFVNPHPFKGAETAFMMAERRPDIPFDFVEGWPLKDELLAEYQSRARALGNIRWIPRQNDMRKVYANARIVLAPSQAAYEAWGRIVTEAHCSGIPVIASKSGGLPESVGPGGLLVDPEGAPENWLSALSEIWDDQDRYESYASSALEYGKRDAIQPETLIRKVIEICEDCRNAFQNTASS